MNKSTLEQWRMFRAVVEHGGFAQAAAAIHKSQSSINHAVHKLQDQLDLQLLEVVGRKAQLTDAGQLMLRRAGQLLDQAEQLETIADSLARGSEAEIHLAVDEVFPPDCLANALEQLSCDYPHTRVELIETVLSGGAERLAQGEVDLLIAAHTPDGQLSEPLMDVEFIAVAQVGHPLHQIERPVNKQDLASHRQIVVRDSTSGERIDSGWLGAEQRWTVSHVATSISMICRGMGFAWLPETRIQHLLTEGILQELPLERGGRRRISITLSFADADRAGPATQRLGKLLKKQALLPR
ncbi:MAG: LysR family transcriptional regulator [Congregibacter sp.]